MTTRASLLWTRESVSPFSPLSFLVSLSSLKSFGLKFVFFVDVTCLQVLYKSYLIIQRRISAKIVIPRVREIKVTLY